MRGKRSWKRAAPLENKFTALGAMQRHIEQGQTWAEVAKACGYETPRAARASVERLKALSRRWQEEQREQRGDEWFAESLPLLSLRLAPGQDEPEVAELLKMLNGTDRYLAEIERAKRSEEVTVAARWLRVDLREEIPLMVYVQSHVSDRRE
jgi:hypothetical protein